MFLFKVPYRGCGVISNLHDDNGKLLKTICVSELLQSHSVNEDFCVKNHMKLARIDSPAVKAAMLNFTNKQYTRFLPGHLFIDGEKFGGWCNCITNQYTVKRDDYQVSYIPCGSGYFGYCEFKQPISNFFTQTWLSNSLFNFYRQFLPFATLKEILKIRAATT
jgi:hypothetical protein